MDDQKTVDEVPEDNMDEDPEENMDEVLEDSVEDQESERGRYSSNGFRILKTMHQEVSARRDPDLVERRVARLIQRREGLN